jgi:hypothetical protein
LNRDHIAVGELALRADVAIVADVLTPTAEVVAVLAD